MNIDSKINTGFEKLHYKNLNSFSGTIYYYHFDGKLSNGWVYENGKIKQSLIAIDKVQYDILNKQEKNAPQLLGTRCVSGFADKYQWQCVGVPGYENCGFNYVGKEYVSYCYWEENEETIDHIAPDENGGYIPPIFIDCADIANGTAIWSYECNTCIGGTTGRTGCANGEVKTDSLNAKFPCAKKLIIDKLNEISGFSNLALPFKGVGEVPNLNWDSKELPWAAGSSNDIYKLGETDNYPGWSSTIYINSKAIQNASKLFVAATAIHEIIHAYSNYLAKKNIYFPNSLNGSWANDVQYWAITDSLYKAGQSNYIQHTNFLEQYFDSTVDILSAFDNNAHTMSEYRMTMLYGLTNAGDVPSSPGELAAYNTRKAKLEGVYNKLLTKYGLTSSQINAFYNNNIKNVSSSNKLPTNCP